MATDELNDEEFDRLTKRLWAYKNDPQSLGLKVFYKCKALHQEISKDSENIKSHISRGIDISTMPDENPVRKELVEWLAKTP